MARSLLSGFMEEYLILEGLVSQWCIAELNLPIS